ncbi:hypothetical protein [uncultured Acetobacteroides sp.]|uniref:hypothetical protein n=1 Tax=uncultured Acetobacteroides sp. TaxID=1760811 RepID=UPI0029F510C7|nr:hypothetical protein [uncultured Acetobacteroides sp.]
MKRYYVIIVLFLFTAVSCDYSDSRLVIKNNSQDTVVFDYALDTVLHERTDREINAILEDTIPPFEERNKSIRGVNDWWGIIIEKSKNKKLNLFILKKEDLSNYIWDEIINRKLYKRYEFTEDELDEINWIVKYP